MRPRISIAELEARRKRAISFSEDRMANETIARRLGVSRRSVNRWIGSWRRNGLDGLAARRAPGRPPKLTQAQRERLLELLALGHKGLGDWSYSWDAFDVVSLIRQ